MFESTKEDLKDLLKRAHEGRLQLPDFQRDYVWGDDDVQSLIASIAKGFPVGALLTLKTGGEVSFKPRPLAGVEATRTEPEELLLDGQQRMTSLYQALYSGNPIRTRTSKNTEVERYYYLNILKATSDAANIEDAIIGVPADRILRKNFGRDIDIDLSLPEHEFKHDMFPLNQIFGSSDWYYRWREYWNKLGTERFSIDKQFFQGVVETITHYKMPIIRVDNQNTREAICLVFEKVNVGGKKLDAFELVTAMYAASNFDLREDWRSSTTGRRHRLNGPDQRRRVLDEVQSTDFLQGCSLLHTRERRLAKAKEGTTDTDLPQISCKREAVLALPLAAYQRHENPVEKGFIEAAAFLNELKIFLAQDIPYLPQVLALASVFAILGDAGRTAGARDKLALWFWCISLGEQYGASTDSKIARDVPQLVDWIAHGGPKPRSIEEAIFQEDRLRSLRSRQSAAYKALHALMMRKGCEDFISGKRFELMTFYNDKVDIHHIFPKAWCKKQGLDPKVYDSIVNKTPLSKKSNILMGGQAPSVYLKQIEARDISPSRLDAILRTHFIEPEFLRRDDFDGFFNARLQAYSRLISANLDRPVVTTHGSNEPETESAVSEDVPASLDNDEDAA